MRTNRRRTAASLRCLRSAERASGSVMPFVAVSLIVLVGTLGIATDFMRFFQCSQELQFASQVAAIYGLSQAANSDGTYSYPVAQTNITNAIIAAGANAWNNAQVGPINSTWTAPVTFTDPGSITFVNNPNQQDPNDFFVQVSGQRNSSDGNALTQFFLPAFTTSFQSTGPGADSSVGCIKISEAVMQPASRIGAGAPAGAQGAAALFVGCGALPIAISNQQFGAIAAAGSTTTGTSSTYTIDFVSSASPAPLAGHITGCFVNVAPSATSGSYYGTASTAGDVNQLKALFSYFGANTGQSAQPPAAVERGSSLNAFDPANTAFQSMQGSMQQPIAQWVATHANNYFVVPVIANNPNFSNAVGGANSVVGFARLRINSVQTGTNRWTMQVLFGESVPMHNATCGEGLQTTTATTSLMPPPVAPFAARAVVDQTTQAMAPRPLGVVMAPAVSPRNLSLLMKGAG